MIAPPGGSVCADAWLRAFEAAAGDGRAAADRLERGRAYAHDGGVFTVRAGPGRITAYVRGSRPRPYRAHWRLPVLSDDAWAVLVRTLAARPAYEAALAEGDIPAQALAEAESAGARLLPAPGDLAPACTCPDQAACCKHAAALGYETAARLAGDPGLLVLLRGLAPEALRAAVRRHGPAAGAPHGASALPSAGGGGPASAAGPPLGGAVPPLDGVAPLGGAVPPLDGTAGGAGSADDGAGPPADGALVRPVRADADAAAAGPTSTGGAVPGEGGAGPVGEAAPGASGHLAPDAAASGPAHVGEDAHRAAAVAATGVPSRSARSGSPAVDPVHLAASPAPASVAGHADGQVAEGGAVGGSGSRTGPGRAGAAGDDADAEARANVGSRADVASRADIESRAGAEARVATDAPAGVEVYAGAEACVDAEAHIGAEVLAGANADADTHVWASGDVPGRSGGAAGQRRGPLVGGMAADAVFGSVVRPPLPAPLPLPDAPGEAAAYPELPGAPSADALAFLATDAAHRAWHALAAIGALGAAGAEGPDDPGADTDPLPDLSLWHDTIRLAATHPRLTGRRTLSPLFASLARTAGGDALELARAAAAWRQGGPAGLTVLETVWDPPAGDFDRGRSALATLGITMTIHHNRLTHPTRPVQLRYGKDGRWYPYRGEPVAPAATAGPTQPGNRAGSGGRDDDVDRDGDGAGPGVEWWPEGPAAADPIRALAGLRDHS
ncbi:hypothetical protein [Streptomyces albus]|uniref:hypothetical protein n=1 Tax=Streptomyces albus TaxID=1888 RepID=UPI003456FDFE